MHSLSTRVFWQSVSHSPVRQLVSSLVESLLSVLGQELQVGGAGGCHVQPDQCIHSILCPVNTEGMKMDRKGRILNMAKGAVHVGTGRLLLNFHLEYECANLRVPLFLRAASDIVVKYSTFVRLTPFLCSLLPLSSCSDETGHLLSRDSIPSWVFCCLLSQTCGRPRFNLQCCSWCHIVSFRFRGGK